MKKPIKATAISVACVAIYPVGLYLLYGLWLPAASHYDELENARTHTDSVLTAALPALVGVIWSIFGLVITIMVVLGTTAAWSQRREVLAKERKRLADRADLTHMQQTVMKLIDRIEALDDDESQKEAFLERARRLYPTESSPSRDEAGQIAVELELLELTS